MGIYYGVFNFTKREWFTGHDLNQGATWGEGLFGLPAKALWILLSPTQPHAEWRGRWTGNDIRVLPDGGLMFSERIATYDDDVRIALAQQATHHDSATDNDEEEKIQLWTNIGQGLFAYLHEHELDYALFKPVRGRGG